MFARYDIKLVSLNSIANRIFPIFFLCLSFDVVSFCLSVFFFHFSSIEKCLIFDLLLIRVDRYSSEIGPCSYICFVFLVAFFLFLSLSVYIFNTDKFILNFVAISSTPCAIKFFVRRTTMQDAWLVRWLFCCCCCCCCSIMLFCSSFFCSVHIENSSCVSKTTTRESSLI